MLCLIFRRFQLPFLGSNVRRPNAPQVPPIPVLGKCAMSSGIEQNQGMISWFLEGPRQRSHQEFKTI